MNIWKQQRKELLDQVAERSVKQRRRGGKKEKDTESRSDEDSDDSLRAGKQLHEESDENQFDSDSFDLAGHENLENQTIDDLFPEINAVNTFSKALLMKEKNSDKYFKIQHDIDMFI